MSVFQLIKEVQKKFRARESEKKELEVCGGVKWGGGCMSKGKEIKTN